MWRGFATPDRAGAYPEHFRDQVVPGLRRVDGFLGADLVRREAGAFIEFTALTRWESMDAVAAFAGDDPGRAVVEPGAVAALDHFDETVSHHEMVEHVPPPG
jgi:heme-degrading monooxygenase HmoA